MEDFGALTEKFDKRAKQKSKLLIQVDEDLRKAFISSCQGQDSTASQELRKFMRDYVKKHGQGDMFK